MQVFLILEIRQKLFILHLFLGGEREGIMTFGWYISLLCPVFSLKDTKIETTITSMFTNHLSSNNYHTVVHVFMLKWDFFTVCTKTLYRESSTLELYQSQLINVKITE